ncbi:uroporphyrinogen-III synthase [Niveibacterium sp. SC-1]|uniref:uroporphyrinogen-III synthase n=1 Tax=Niveibacterium sp. SC-1 TaxID=3135646 RepID=UPI00311EFE6A
MTQGLAGRRIVVTRPAEQAESLCQAIVARGGEALRAPLIAIEAADDAATRHELAALALDLRSFDLVFFVSANAVQHGLSALRLASEWPSHLGVATVGPGSAAALHAAGFERVIAPTAQFDSEAVLALPEFAPDRVRGRSILVLRGDGGRELLADALRERGARVRLQTCYRRRMLAPDLPELLAARPDALVVSSSEALRSFERQLAANVDAAVLRLLPLFAPHARIAALAESLGFPVVFTTEGADAGIIAGLERYFASGAGAASPD